MSQEQQAPPAFPEARAKKLSEKKSIWLIALFGLMALMLGTGLVAGIIGYLDGRAGRAFGESIIPWILMTITFAAMIPTLWWSLRYWKSIDEMARRAHLDAFFWGGGMISWAIFLPLIVPMLTYPQFQFAPIENLDASRTHAFGLGAFAAVMVTLFGYGFYWLYWWAKKR